MPRMLSESFTNVHYHCTSTLKVIPSFSISTFLDTLRCILGMKFKSRHYKGKKKSLKIVSVWFLHEPRAMHPHADVRVWAGASPKVGNGVGWNLGKWLIGWKMHGRVSQNMIHICDKYSWSFYFKSWKVLKYSRMPLSQWKILTTWLHEANHCFFSPLILLGFFSTSSDEWISKVFSS